MKILAINYSQSGQLDEIIENFISPLTHVEVDRIKFNTVKKFDFPWTVPAFFDTMPECVKEIPTSVREIAFQHEKYDLILFGYQPWFLSPSIPTTSLLKDPIFKNILKNTPIITIIGSRNMWLNSQESVVHMIKEANGRIIGNLPLVDRSSNIFSAASILHWMLTGKKEKKWGIFPMPGISEEDIKGSSKYGEILNQCLKNNTLYNYQNELVKANGLSINTNILFIEGRAKTIFKIWANLILKKEAQGKKRSFWVSFFKYYLVIALFVVSPFVVLIYNVLIRPFTGKSIREKKKKYTFLGINE